MAPENSEHNPLAEQVGRKEERKQASLQEKHRGIWFGLGMFGLVGWSVALPSLMGLALGVWLDQVLQDTISWRLTGLIAGVALGCWNAWYWVQRFSRRG